MRLARCSLRVVIDGGSHSGLTVQEAEKFPDLQEQELNSVNVIPGRFVHPGRFVQLQKIKRVNHPPTSTTHHATKSA